MKEKGKYRQILKSLVSNIWYIIALVIVCTVIIFLISNWSATLLAMEHLISVLMPFILAVFLTYLILPLVKIFTFWLNQINKGRWKRINKGISVTASYLLIIGIIVILIFYIFPQIKESTKELGISIQTGYNYAVRNQEKINNLLPLINLGDIIMYLKENIFGNFMDHSSRILPYVYNLSSSLFSTVYNCIMALVISIYMVWDNQKLVKGLKRGIYAVAPKGREEGIWRTLKQCNHIFNGFIFGKAVDSLIIGILCLIVMSILRLPYALLLSLIVCITNMIPYFGPLIGAIPGVLIYLFIDPKLALIFAVMILVLQQFDGLYLGPKILGDLTNIKPLWVIFGITVGGAYFGVLGMFLGVPVMAMVMYLVDMAIDKKLKKKKISMPS